MSQDENVQHLSYGKRPTSLYLHSNVDFVHYLSHNMRCSPKLSYFYGIIALTLKLSNAYVFLLSSILAGNAAILHYPITQDLFSCIIFILFNFVIYLFLGRCNV